MVSDPIRQSCRAGAGASQAKRLSIALVVVMLVGVILAGVDQVVRLDSHVGTVIDTTLLIARAILAVLYSRVIHRLRREDPTGTLQSETVQLDEVVTKLLTEMITAAFHDLSQHLDERLTILESKQADAQAHLRQETATMLADAGLHDRDIDELKHTQPVPKARPFVEEQTKTLSGTPKREIDDSIWSLLSVLKCCIEFFLKETAGTRSKIKQCLVLVCTLKERTN